MSSAAKRQHFFVSIRSPITGAMEIHPMKAWLRENATALPSGIDPCVCTSHKLSRALRKLGWQILESDTEYRLIQPGIDGDSASIHQSNNGTQGQHSERQWVHNLVPALCKAMGAKEGLLEVRDGYRLPYTSEILQYSGDAPDEYSAMRYETDLLVSERSAEGSSWIPRVVVEAKLGAVTTHDAITYSQKATTHKSIHPYLRYGIFVGRQPAIPRRLFRHGASFDFMLSWADSKPSAAEFDRLVNLLIDEVNASRKLQQLMFKTQPKAKLSYTMLQKRIELL